MTNPMQRFREDVVALLREKAGTALDEVRALGGIASDAGRYALDRLRERYLGERRRPALIEAVLEQIFLDATNGLIEAKKAVAISIADEKRLAKQVEQEDANAAEWARRADLAEEAGDPGLAAEARSRQLEHAALAIELQELWTRQKADVERLKDALRRLNNRIEGAKRDKNRILSRQRIAATRQEVQRELGRIDGVIRMLDRLGEIDALLEKEPLDGTEGQGPLH